MSIQKYLKIACFCLPFASFSSKLEAQVVYKTDFPKDANVKVYVTSYQKEADVVVFKTPFIHNADGNNGLWYFTPYSGEANKKICYTLAKDNADLIVFWTTKKEDAGWLNKKKKYLMR